MLLYGPKDNSSYMTVTLFSLPPARLQFAFIRTQIAALLRTSAAFLMALGLVLLTAQMSLAQSPSIYGTAHFSGANKVIMGGLSLPEGVAVDSNGNVYVADYGNSRVVEATLANHRYTTNNVLADGGSYPYGVAVDKSFNIYVADPEYGVTKCAPQAGGGCIQSRVGHDLQQPHWVAVDVSGNVYISDLGLGQVLKETLQLDGSYVQTVIYTGSNSEGVAVDASGNVYIAELSSGEVLKETLQSGGSYLQSVVVSGLCDPAGVAVDGSGNVYVANNCNDQVLQETPQSGGSYLQSVIASGLSSPIGVAVDGSGNVYVVNGIAQQVVELLPAGADFGPVDVGSTSSVIGLRFTVDTVDQTSWNLQLKAKEVRTQGALGLDFADTASGTCNTKLLVGDVCTLNITYTPQFPGTGYGAGALTNAAGQEIATGYVKGTGVGPLVNFSPATQELLFNNLSSPKGMAADGSGNVYVADTGNKRIVKATASQGYGQSVVSSSSLSGPSDVAVDGNGNVYIADTGNNRVLKETLQYNGSWVESTVGSGLANPAGIAVDGGGNLYIADTGNNRLIMETLALGNYSQSVVGSGLNTPVGVSVDGSGNVYVLDGGPSGSGKNPGVYLETLQANRSYTQSLLATSTLVNPNKIAVDGSGNLYITDIGVGGYRVLKETLTSGSYSESLLTVAGLNSPWGVAVDGSGNAYVSDSLSSMGSVSRLHSSIPPVLSFAHTTDMGATDTTDGPQTVTVKNIGNADLTLPAPVAGMNPSIAANYSLDTSAASACPQVSSTSSAATLPAGANCSLAVNFVPTTYGNIGGSLVLTDNNLNTSANYAAQTILLKGTGAAPTQILFNPLPAITLGDTLRVSARGSYADGLNLDISSLLSWSSSNTGVANFAVAADPTLIYSFATGTTNITASLGSSTTPIPVTQVLTVDRLSSPVLGASFSPASVSAGSTNTTTFTVKITNSNAIALSGLALSNNYPAGLVADSVVSSTCFGSISSTPAGYSLAYGTLAAGATCTIAVSMHATNAGIYTDTTSTATSNEALPAPSISKSLVVGTIAATLSLNCTEVNYDGNPHSCSGVAKGVNGETVSGSWSFSPSSATNIGSTSVVGTFTSSDANYTNGSASGTLKINAAAPTLALLCSEVPYNGAPHTCTGSATGVGGTVVSGSWNLTPASATNAGTTAVSGTFTSADSNYYSGSTSGTLTIDQISPTITWATPVTITYGTALNSTQLNANASVPGSYLYTPPTGTVLNAGPNQALSVTFTPTDTTNYTTATKAVAINVTQITPTITWATPSAIAYGTALSSTQLNANASVPGSYAYTPTTGTILSAGSHQTLSVTFTPTDTTNYATATKTVTINVNQTAPVLTLSCIQTTYDGAPHTCTGVATGVGGVAVSGSWSFNPASATNVGSTTVVGTFTSSDANYTNGTASGTLKIDAATPVISWANPAPIVYGTALTGAQLNATASVPGSFTYLPTAGTVLSVGTNQTLSATFKPTDTVNYKQTTGNVLITVNGTAQTITLSSATSAYAGGVTYGVAPLALSATGGASGNPVVFSVLSGPATIVGNILTVTGAGQIRIAANQAAGGNYAAATQVTEQIPVNQVMPTIKLTANASASFLQNPVLLTATVSSSVSMPSGWVTFLDGTTQLGTIQLTAGVATLSVTTLPAGSHSITAIYAGDTNFLTSTSGAVAEFVADFAINFAGGSATVMPGSSAQFTFTVTPPNGTTLPAPIALTISGLPTGATYTFSPSTLPAGSGATTVTLTIQVPATTASAHTGEGSGRNNVQNSKVEMGRRIAPFTLALLLLPFAGRTRRAGRRLARTLSLLALLALGLTTAALTGCGSNSGFFLQPQKTYTVTVTATAGSLSHSAPVTLTVE